MSDTPREQFDKWWSNMAPKDDRIMPAGHAWNGFVAGYQWMRSQLERELAVERERSEWMRVALEWYADKARACAKHSHSGQHTALEALLASVTVLALDGGKRADAAMRMEK